ncbi:MAG: CrcB family protein [Saccharothrix sp.]|nr:CrcB family protein [Saccharothrix sp.]
MPTDPVDPDVDLHVPAQRQELARTHGGVLAVIALGGGLGGLARYGVGLLLPGVWSTMAVNVAGGALIGVLMVLITEKWQAHPLARPFLGVGVLGGFTTFSSYTNDFRHLLAPGGVLEAFAYLVVTLVAAVGATALAVALTRRAVA